MAVNSKQAGQLANNFRIYINALKQGIADPGYISDAVNIAKEITPYLDQYPDLKGLVDQFNTTVQETAPQYAGLSENQRPGEEVDAQGNVTGNIYQQQLDQQQGGAQPGGDDTSALNNVVSTMQQQGSTPEQVGQALQQQGASDQQINQALQQGGATIGGDGVASWGGTTQAGTSDSGLTLGQFGLKGNAPSTTSAMDAVKAGAGQVGSTQTGTSGGGPASWGGSTQAGTSDSGLTLGQFGLAGNEPSTTSVWDAIKSGAGQVSGQPGAGTPNLDSQGGMVAANQILDQYLQSGRIDQGTYDLFKQAVGMWDPASEINIDNIMKTFLDIKSTTIDPYFKEQATIFTDNVQRDLGFMQGERSRQLEQEGVQSSEAIRGAQGNLEARGMTFTGEAGRQLGQQSAFRTSGQQPGVVPVQKFGEGLIPQQNRLIATSSQARYQKNLADLARQAEVQLGSDAAGGLVPGVDQLGGVKGSMPREQNKGEAATLTGLFQQEQQNAQYREPLQVFK